MSSSRKNQLVYLRFQKANKLLGMPIIVAKRKKRKKKSNDSEVVSHVCMPVCTSPGCLQKK